MAYKFDYYKDLAQRMVDNDQNRDKAFRYYQKMRRMDYKLPDNVNAVPGIRKVVDTSPSDAISKAGQVMASRPPKLRLMPAINNPDGRERANVIERILKWQLLNADRGRPVGVVADTFESAALYGAVALNVMDLDHQLKVVEDEAMRKKLERARKYRRFVVNTFNPQDVHVRRSSLGVECVLLCQERPAFEVAAEYPAAKKALKDSIEAGHNVLFKHYTDYDSTCAWVEASGMDAKQVIAPTDHELPFLYWIAMMGGSTLESAEEHKYKPILYPVYMSDEWETKNVVDTLMTSDVIWKALAPVIAVTGSPDEVEYDTGDPQRRVMNVPMGNVQPLPAQQVDPALFTISQEFKGRMMDSTVSTLLGGSDIPSGTSFAALNLQTQTALGALKPAKELTEKALAEMFTLMMQWVSYTGIDLSGYNTAVRSEQYAEEYVLPADEIDDENIYISVELDPDEPTDKLQRANTATLLKQLGYSNTSALEDMGVEDPEQELERSYEERLDELEFSKYEQTQQMELQMMAQGMQAQEQQAQEAQMMAQQQQLNGAIPGGQGFNPAMGGEPPAMAFPGGTREEVLGQLGAGGQAV